MFILQKLLKLLLCTNQHYDPSDQTTASLSIEHANNNMFLLAGACIDN
jgi:hypothetical protein